MGEENPAASPTEDASPKSSHSAKAMSPTEAAVTPTEVVTEQPAKAKRMRKTPNSEEEQCEMMTDEQIEELTVSPTILGEDDCDDADRENEAKTVDPTTPPSPTLKPLPVSPTEEPAPRAMADDFLESESAFSPPADHDGNNDEPDEQDEQAEEDEDDEEDQASQTSTQRKLERLKKYRKRKNESERKRKAKKRQERREEKKKLEAEKKKKMKKEKKTKVKEEPADGYASSSAAPVVKPPEA